jgi:hypothetical protein
MSEVRVNKISPRSGTTVTLGDNGDTISIPSGVTLDASNATTTLPANVVTTTGSQTLTNKTIGSSQLTGALPAIDGSALTGIPDTIAPTRHSIRPSLNLDFANSKELDPRITFTRASNATYYDGYTSVKAEENLLFQSQTFDSGNWQKIRGTITANSTTAPDGTATASTFIEDTSSIGKYLVQAKVVVAGAYTSSIFAKANTRSWSVIRLYDGSADKSAYFDLTNGVLGTVDAGVTATITSVGDGWYRCTHTYTLTAGNRQFQFMISDADNTADTYTGDGTSSIYIWGAQVEQRDTVTAYTPTTTQPITNYVPVLQTAGNNVARFDHNPTTGESLGLLIEESTTNLVTRSEEFDNAYWSKTNYTAKANQTLAPDGTLSADLLILDDGVSAGVTKSIARGTFTTSGTSAFSIYIKNFGCTGTFSLQDGAGNGVTFNLENNTKSNFGSFISSPVAEDVGNGWYRLKFATSTTSNSFFMYQSGFTGNGHNGVFLWGAQFEQAKFPTSYIKTTGSTVTRSPDKASMTGTNFSDWYRQDEGSIYVEDKMINLSTDHTSVVGIMGGNTNDRRILLFRNFTGATDQFEIYNYGNQVSFSKSRSVGVYHKVAVALKTNDVALSLDGQAALTDSVATIPLVDRLEFGSGLGTSFSVNYVGYIRKLAYYPLRLTNNEITDLSEE